MKIVVVANDASILKEKDLGSAQTNTTISLLNGTCKGGDQSHNHRLTTSP